MELCFVVDQMTVGLPAMYPKIVMAS